MARAAKLRVRRSCEIHSNDKPISGNYHLAVPFASGYTPVNGKRFRFNPQSGVKAMKDLWNRYRGIELAG